MYVLERSLPLGLSRLLTAENMSAPIVNSRNWWRISAKIAKYAINSSFNFTESDSFINRDQQTSEAIKNQGWYRPSAGIPKNSINSN